MPGYISEFIYYGDAYQEFIEVALPQGTDPSSFSISIYDVYGYEVATFGLGASTGTMAGHDVYVVNASTPGFLDVGDDPTGNLYPDDAIALVNPDGSVEQFLSYWGTTVTGQEGPVSGLTSVDVGTSNFGQSMQSDNGGSSYYAQSVVNSGKIPACYAPGSLILTATGPKPIECIEIGDKVQSPDGALSSVKWLWSGVQPLEEVRSDQKPVLICEGALGNNRPDRDLIVSGQHRIVVGGFGQLEDIFDRMVMIPAKVLTDLRGIRFMKGKKTILWHHFLCDGHRVIDANGVISESLLLGPEFMRSLPSAQRCDIVEKLGRPIDYIGQDRPALPCLSVGAARQVLQSKRPKRWSFAARNSKKTPVQDVA